MRVDYTIYSDEELVELLQKGEERAFKTIYERYWKPLYFSAFAVLKDESVCKDIVQEFFISLWQRRGQLNIQSSLKGYLFTAIRYLVFKEVRKSKEEALFSQLDERLSSWNGDSNLLVAEIERLVAAAVAGLPEGCREVYLLSRQEGLSRNEIADRLDISGKTVANQLTKALRHIRTSISQFFLLF